MFARLEPGAPRSARLARGCPGPGPAVRCGAASRRGGVPPAAGAGAEGDARSRGARRPGRADAGAASRRRRRGRRACGTSAATWSRDSPRWARSAWVLPRVPFYPVSWVVPLAATAAFLALLWPGVGGAVGLVVLAPPVFAFSLGWGFFYLVAAGGSYALLRWRHREWAVFVPGIAPLLAASGSAWPSRLCAVSSCVGGACSSRCWQARPSRSRPDSRAGRRCRTCTAPGRVPSSSPAVTWGRWPRCGTKWSTSCACAPNCCCRWRSSGCSGCPSARFYRGPVDRAPVGGDRVPGRPVRRLRGGRAAGHRRRRGAGTVRPRLHAVRYNRAPSCAPQPDGGHECRIEAGYGCDAEGGIAHRPHVLGVLRPLVQGSRPTRRAGRQDGQGDGRPQDGLAVAHLRAQPGDHLPLPRGPRAVLGLRARSRRRTRGPRVAVRAREGLPTRAVRPRSRSRPIGICGWASSASAPRCGATEGAWGPRVRPSGCRSARAHGARAAVAAAAVEPADRRRPTATSGDRRSDRSPATPRASRRSRPSAWAWLGRP